jgi:hypothetical protein
MASGKPGAVQFGPRGFLVEMSGLSITAGAAYIAYGGWSASAEL